MKAFLAAIVVLIVITVAADYVLDYAGFSSVEVFQRDNVRLDG